jgi:hypothetical protein
MDMKGRFGEQIEWGLVTLDWRCPLGFGAERLDKQLANRSWWCLVFMGRQEVTYPRSQRARATLKPKGAPPAPEMSLSWSQGQKGFQ